MNKRGKEKIIQELLKRIGESLIKESEPEEPKKTVKEEFIEVYTASEPTKMAKRYNIPPIKVSDNNVLLALESIQKDREQIAKQKESLKQDQIRIADQHQSLERAKLEINGKSEQKN